MGISESGASVVGFFLLYSNKATMMQKSKSTNCISCSYSVCEFRTFWRSWLVNNEHNAVGSVPVASVESQECLLRNDFTSKHGSTCRFTVEVESFAPLTWDVSGRFWEMDMLHKTCEMLLDPFNYYKLSAISTKWKHGTTENCLPFLVSYCCDVPEAKDMSYVRCETGEQRPSPRILA